MSIATGPGGRITTTVCPNRMALSLSTGQDNSKHRSTNQDGHGHQPNEQIVFEDISDVGLVSLLDAGVNDEIDSGDRASDAAED